MKKHFFAVIALASLLPVSGFARGIAMRFVDITLENVEPGTVLNIRTFKNLPMVVMNLEDEPTEIGVKIDLPDAKELKEGYEPLPDPNWIKILPDHFHLGPKASSSADVIINIPNDPKLIGHHYEGIIWVHTAHPVTEMAGGGVMIETGLRSRVRISIGTKGPESLQREKALKKLATINTNFTVNPDNVYVAGVDLGRTVDLKTEKKASIKVINQADDPVNLKFTIVQPDPNVSLQTGYVPAPDLKWLELSPDRIKSEGNSIKELKFKLTIPDKPEYHNQKYAFVVQTTLADEELPLAINNVIYITTQP